MSHIEGLTENELLQRFKEAHPAFRTVAQIARVGETQFVEAFGQDDGFFAGDARQARSVHRTAVAINTRNALIWANIKDAVASPYVRGTLFDNIPDRFIRHQESIPGYERLFGDLDYIECDHCRSVLGPAAYFVDLMRFIDENISQKAEAARQTRELSGTDDQSLHPITLRQRRPDLFDIRLDCHNTHDLIPYIDLVNEVLESIVRTPQQRDAYELLHDIDFPQNLPFNKPLEEIRAYLKQLKTNLHAIYAAFQALDANGQPQSSYHVAREILSLSPADYALLANGDSRPTTVERLYGGKTLSELTHLTVFLEQTGLTRAEVQELVYQDLDGDELNAGLSRLFFINSVADGLGPLRLDEGPGGPQAFDERFVNLTYAKLARIYRFVKLARKLGWSFTDLDWVLRAIQGDDSAGTRPYQTEKSLRFDGISDYVACRRVTGLDLATFTVEAWINPTRHGRNIIVTKGSTDGSSVDFAFFIDGEGRLGFSSSGLDTAQPPPRGSQTIRPGVFTHVALTVSSDTARFYVNGLLDANSPLTLQNPLPTAGANLEIGRNLLDEHFDGLIKDVRLWRGVRSQQNIAANRFRRMTGQETDLSGCWPLTGNRWNVLFDLTPNRNDGVLGGEEFVTQPTWSPRSPALDPLPEPVARQGLQFNGRDQFLATRGATGLESNTLTLEAWIKRAGSDEYEIMAKGDEGNGRTHFRLWLTPAGNVAFKSTSLGADPITNEEPIPKDRWTHVCVMLPASAAPEPRYSATATAQQHLADKNVHKAVLEALASTSWPTTITGKRQFLDALNTAVGSAQLKVINAKEALKAMWKAMDAHTLSSDGLTQPELDKAFTALGEFARDARATRDEAGQAALDRHISEARRYLEALLGRQFDTQDDLTAALAQAVGHDITQPHASTILAHCEQLFVRIFVNGRFEDFPIDAQHRSAETGSIELRPEGDSLVVGRQLRTEDGYFAGSLKELRLWHTLRTPDQVQLDRHRALSGQEPGLLGYWRFNEIVDAQARDLTSQANHLQLGGISADYAPDRISVAQLLPPPPIAVAGTAVHLDGNNDYISIKHTARCLGLGHYAQFTLSLWFNAADAGADGAQLLLAQGDAEDGLSIYLHDGQLKTAAWHNNYERTHLETTGAWAAAMVQTESWHHVAIVKDASTASDSATLRAYLDGQEIGSVDVAFQLSPSGLFAVGGLPRDALVCFDSGYASDTRAFFTGRLTDLRLWQTAHPQAAIDNGRFAAPALPDDDLVLYFPMAEGHGRIRDTRTGRDNSATFETTNRVLIIDGGTSGSEYHSHYTDPASLGWADYAYTGRLYIAEAETAVGITFYSRFPEFKDQYYALRRSAASPSFHFSAHPETTWSASGRPETGVVPLPKTWYRFRVEVTQTGSGTEMRAKVWPAGAPEPRGFQAVAQDSLDVHLRGGSVGVWSAGSGMCAFDDLQVTLLNGDASAQTLYALDFEQVDTDGAPQQWMSTQTTRTHRDNEHLFEVYDAGYNLVPGLPLAFRNMAYGTDFELDGIHSHYMPRRALGWDNYALQGRMLITDPDGAVGVTFYNRHAAGQELYYRLGRSADTGTFVVSTQEHGLQTLQGQVDSSVTPVANRWYDFYIEVETTAARTYIRAAIWPESERFPGRFQIDAFDDSDVRLHRGSIGVWAAGRGRKFVDTLRVYAGSFNHPRVMYLEDFLWPYRQHDDAIGWQDAGPREIYILPDLFTVREIKLDEPRWQNLDDYPLLLRPLDRKALRFDGRREYAAAEDISGLDLQQFTLEAWVNPSRQAMNPIFSLRQDAQSGPQLTLSITRSGQAQARIAPSERGGTAVTATTVLPTNTDAHLALTVDGTQLTLYVNGQPEASGTVPDPVSLQPTLAELGRAFGGDRSRDYFSGEIRDVRLWQGARTQSDIENGRFQLPDSNDPNLLGFWTFDDADDSPLAADSAAANAHLRLGGLPDARRPVLGPTPLRVPEGTDMLDPAALKLDGQNDFYALPDLQLARLGELTLEAWIRLDRDTGQQTLWQTDRNRFVVGWQDDRLSVTLTGTTPRTHVFDYGFERHVWTHIAIVYSRGEQSVSLFVNGRFAAESACSRATSISLGSVHIGATGGQSDFLRGLVKELRLWQTARTTDDISGAMFQRLTGQEPNLVGHWPFSDEASLPDAPAWVSPDLLATELGHGFWRPQRQVLRTGSDSGLAVRIAPAAAQNGSCQRRTVEVWFKVDDKYIAHRKQVVYHAGDDRSGLTIYVHDGLLFFGGYNLLDDANDCAHWPGTWLSTDRIRSGKWHHAAIVLDGRSQVRPNTFRAYLDGKLVDVGAGAQLSVCSGPLALGTPAAGIRFHDTTTTPSPRAAPPPEPEDTQPPPPMSPPPTPTTLGDDELDNTAVVFSGTSQPTISRRPFDDFPGQTLTIECWLKPRAISLPGTVLSYAASQQNDNALVLYLYRHQALTVLVNGQIISARGVATLRHDVWQHVAVTWRASDGAIEIYVDAQRTYSGFVSPGMAIPAGGSLVLGQDQDFVGGRFDPAQAYHGMLNEVRLWDHVRTPEQIADGMLRPCGGDTAGQVWCWPGQASAPVPAGGSRGTAVPTGNPATTTPAPTGGSGPASGASSTTAVTTTPSDHYLTGAVMDLRVWETARTRRDLTLHRFRQLVGSEPQLALWWQFEQLNGMEVPDLSGNGRTATLSSTDQLTTLGAEQAYQLPLAALNALVLERLATVKRLHEEHGLELDKLTALWYTVPHTGRADGRTLFDATFNPPGSVQDTWQYAMETPLRWDTSGATNQLQSQRIQSRLMGALQVSEENLRQLVAVLNGPEETIIELDGAYLCRLYQLARAPGFLSLSLPEFTQTLKELELPGIEGLASFMRVYERAAWMQETGIDIFEFLFLARDVESEQVRFGYTDAAIRDRADDLRRQSRDFLARPDAFVTEEISQGQSQIIYDRLRERGSIDALGAVQPDYEPPDGFDELAQALNLRQALAGVLGETAVQSLQQNGFIDANGLIDARRLDDKNAFSDEQLRPLFSDAGTNRLSTVRDALEQRARLQRHLAETLISMRDQLQQAALEALSDLVGAPPDRTAVVAAHFADDMTLTEFFKTTIGIDNEATAVPDTLIARGSGFLYQCSKVLFLTSQFALTTDEVTALLAQPEQFSVQNILRPGIDDLQHLHIFSTLKRAFQDDKSRLIALLAQTGKQEILQAIYDLTGWEPGQVGTLLEHFGSALAANRVDGLARLRRIFDLARQLRVDVAFMLRLAATDDLSYDFYRLLSADLWHVLRAHYDDPQWEKVQRPIHDRLAVAQRDALLAKAMLEITQDFQGRRSADLLYEYLLLDVQTGSEVDTSRIVQALASLQFYLQRCLLNLENGIDPAWIPQKQWEWMKNYRVWEANRKVFLYPENYIEPELRDTKTPFFADLEQEFMQGELSKDAVESAYLNYLQKFATVADLKIVGSYYHLPDRTGGKEQFRVSDEPVLYLLGRTKEDTPTYYLRKQVNGRRWTPWEKIDLTIPSKFATPVFAFNRLFIFWTEFTKGTEARPKRGADGKVETLGNTGVQKTENVDVYKASIRYTYENLSQGWAMPQTYMHLGRNLEKHEYIQPKWERVYAQRSLEFFDTPPQQADQTVTEPNALVAQFSRDTFIEQRALTADMSQLTWSFWVNFENRTRPEVDQNHVAVETAVLLAYNQPLFGLLDKTDFQVEVTNNVTAVPGAPTSEEIAALKKTMDDAKAAADADDAAKQQAFEDARQAHDDAVNHPQWESKDLLLTVSIEGDEVFRDIPVSYDWQHIAITMQHDAQNNEYALVLHLNDTAHSQATRAGGTLAAGKKLQVGKLARLARNAPTTAFETQMSELRLWDSVRTAADISRDRDQRLPGQGLINLPLNTVPGGAIVDLVESNLTFTTAFKTFPPVERERIVLLWGDQFKSLRNTLQDDQSFNLKLKEASDLEPSYDVDLRDGWLYVAQSIGLSVNDYARPGESTLSRFSPDIRAIAQRAASGQTDLSEEELKRLLPSLAMLSAFGTVPFMDGKDLRTAVKALLDSMGLTADALTQGQIVDASDSYLMQNVAAQEASLIDVNNQPGWYIFDSGDEQFLIRTLPPSGQTLRTAVQRLKFETDTQKDPLDPPPVAMYFEDDPALNVSPQNPLNAFRFQFDRLDTSLVRTLSLKLFAQGIDGLLSLPTQEETEYGQIQTFQQRYDENEKLVIPPDYQPHTGKVDHRMNFDGPYGLYLRELFFHIPFFIANQLNAQQQFDAAQRWYHYIFNPTIGVDTETAVATQPNEQAPNDRYWRYRPFRGLSIETLHQILTNEEALDEYKEDPFDPHAIARLRLNAYQKAVVMKYIDNLLDWGDQLFTQDTRESINEAAQLYVLSYNILGPRPLSKSVRDDREVGTFDEIEAQLNGRDLPDFLVEFARRAPSTNGSAAGAITPNNSIISDFRIVENELFMGYWDRVEDRLYKIRHSLNIQGIFRRLALFQPPIDPMALVRAVAGGRDLGSVLSDLNVPVPHYRYGFMIEKAKDMTSTVIDLGGALLDALEKADAEDLASLQNTHERQILNLTTKIKENEVNIIEETIKALDHSKEIIGKREERLTNLLAAPSGLNGGEIAWFTLKAAQLVSVGVKTVAESYKEFANLPPKVEAGAAGVGGSPMATTGVDGSNYGSIPGGIAALAGGLGDMFGVSADIAMQAAEFERRRAEWEHEKAIAELEEKEIEQQIEIARLQLEIAQRDLAIHQKQLEQNRDIADFYRRKFSNRQLYGWMISRLSGLYYQAYKLAYDYAKGAERAMQYELPTTQRFISFGHWDSLKKGLLAGESLMLELRRMEKFQLDQDSRFQNVTRTISLRREMPDVLQQLMAGGTAEFALTEALFDRDFPGHYARMINRIAISIDAPVDEFTPVNATLTQLGSRTLLQPDLNAVRYLMGQGDEQPDTSVLRTNWRANQQVAISQARDDAGMFGDYALNLLFDDRYFPFEGTGAVSSWQLEMQPNARLNLADINDVVIHLKYTALTESGGFKEEVARLAAQTS